MTVGMLTFLSNGVSTPEGVGARLGLVVVLAVAGNALVQDTVRDLYVGLALTCATLVFAAGLAGGVAVAVPLIIGAGLVAGCLGLLGTARISEGRLLLTPAGPGARRRLDAGLLGAASVAALAVGALLFLLVPHPPGLRTQGKLGAALRTAVGAPSGGSAPGGPADGGGLSRAPRPAHARRTPRRPGRERAGGLPSPVAGPGVRQLRRVGLVSPQAPMSRSFPSAGTGAWSIPTEPGTNVRIATRTDDVRPAAAAPPLVLSPGQPASIQAGTRPVRTSEGSYFLPRGGGAGYAVTSHGYDALQLPTGVAVARADGDVSNPVWTSLPTSVPARVRQLGQTLAAGAHDRAEVVSRVEQYLAAHEKYRLDAPIPPAGQDVVDAFLFDSHEGFCEHFAAAETVLLRSVGIPSRLVAGYGAGRATADGRRLLIASDAHAWVEVYAPGIGWTASDPTAGAALSSHHRSVLERLTDAFRQALRTPGGRALLAGLLVLVLLTLTAVGVLVRRVLARRPDAGEAVPVDRLLGALVRLEAALAGVGRPRLAAETLSELAQRLARQDGSRVSLAAADGLLVLARSTYAPTPPSPPDRSHAAAAIETYAATLEAEAGTGAAEGALRRRTGTRAGASR